MRIAQLIGRAMMGVLMISPIIAQAQPTPSTNTMAAGANVPNGAAARPLTAEQKADADAVRAIIKAAPDLPLRRVELKVKPNKLLGPISAMSEDQHGNLYVIHRPTDPNVDPIVVLDSKGNFVRSFGKGLFTIPHGIRVDPAGNVWAIDAHTSVVYKFTPEGKQLLKVDVGNVPDPKRPFCGATDVTFAKNGNFFISDGYCNARFIEYSADGKKLHEWGSKGTGPGQFRLAHDIALSADNILYVADRENGRLQWFDMNGKYIGEHHFGGQLFSVAIGPAGDLYVGLHARGVPYEEDSAVLKFDPKSGKVLGKVMVFAHQLSVGPDGALLPGQVVVKVGNDPATSTILLFRPSGAQ